MLLVFVVLALFSLGVIVSYLYARIMYLLCVSVHIYGCD